jgi:cation/acetate symporter
VIKKGKADSAAELKVSRITTLALGVLAVTLGIVFEKQNIAFMVSLAFAIAASANFPVLFMSVLWKDCTTKGAVIGGFLGLISSVGADRRVALGVGSHAGQPQGFGAVPLHLAGAVLHDHRLCGHLAVLHPDRSPNAAKERAAFPAQQVRSETGLGASGASGH